MLRLHITQCIVLSFVTKKTIFVARPTFSFSHTDKIYRDEHTFPGIVFFKLKKKE